MTTATLIVRRVMQQFGKSAIWTNKYKTCRTVKCYQGDDDTEMVKSIYKALVRNGIGHQMNIKIVNHTGGLRSSLIIRLPL